MRAAQHPDSMALTPFASATCSGRWIWQENKKIRAANESLFWFVLDFTAEVVRHFLPLMQVYLALCFEICC